nr:phytoene desaturase family protein [Phaeovibrio sulfidiphilus]
MDTASRPAVGKARPHAVVIGSGFGGLAAGVRLSARGYRVTVVEALPDVGGRARVFRQDGHAFDAGPTIVTAPYMFADLWELCGKRMEDHVQLKKLDPFYTVRLNDGRTFRVNDDPEFMREEVGRFAPGNVEGYERYLKESGDIFNIGFKKMSDTPFDTLWDMLKVVPYFAWLRSDRTVAQHAAKCMSDPNLQMCMGFHPLFVGGNPYSVTSVYSLIAYLERHWGVWWAMGGTGRLAEGLADLIRGQGGEIRTSAQVDKILVDGRRARGVRLMSGEEIRADIVVSNADSTVTYKTFLPSDYPLTALTKRRQRQSMSLFVWYVGTKGTRNEWPEMGHHTIAMGPRYKGLLDDIFHRRHLADDFSLYIHRPSATDPSVAPEGDDTFYILSPVPNMLGDASWPQAADAYRDRIADYIERELMPGFRSRISTSRMITPAYFETALQSTDGAAFGPEPLFLQSAWLRPHNRSKDVDGLYLVGAGTHPGAGLPGVLSSALILDKVVPDASTFA